MSYYSTWHLEEEVIIFDPAGFFEWVGKMRKEGHEALVDLIRWDVYESTEEDSLTIRTIKKTYFFSGFYPADMDFGNGKHGINHFSPSETDSMNIITAMSRFMEPFAFLVFGEGWPALGNGYVHYVWADNGDANATAYELLESP